MSVAQAPLAFSPGAGPVLALETTTATPSLALHGADGTLHTWHATIARSSDVLHSALQTLLRTAGLNLADVTELRLTVGPGSFTGIRMGLLIADMLALSRTPLAGQGGKQKELSPPLRVVAVPTLQLWAAAACVRLNVAAGSAITVLTDAGAQQVYVQQFQMPAGSGSHPQLPSPLGQPTVLPLPRLWQQLASPPNAAQSLVYVGDSLALEDAPPHVVAPLLPLQAADMLVLPAPLWHSLASLNTPVQAQYVKPLTYRPVAAGTPIAAAG